MIPSDLDPEGVCAFLGMVFRDAADAIGVSHRNTVRMANPAMLRLFGCALEDLVGRSIPELIAPESRPAIVESVRRRAAGEPVPGVYSAWAQRPDGTRFRVDIRTTTFEVGGEHYSIALLHQLGRGSAAELYRAVFESNTAVKLLIDPVTGQIVDANEAASVFYGWSLPVLRTMRIDEINTLSPEELATELEDARTGRRRHFHFRHRIASGEVRHVDVHTGTVEVDGRSMLLSIVQDVTERVVLGERLREAEKLEAVGRLAGGVAHDFNNLLTIMLGSADLLAAELEPDSVAAQRLGDVLHAARRAGDLTRRLLEAGGRDARAPQRVDLRAGIERVLGLLQTAVGPDVRLIVDAPSGLFVEMDPVQLERVLTNLALNARDAMPTGGTLWVRARRDGPCVVLEVQDDGLGMDESVRARIFEPFFTTKELGRGHGLGLSSVWGIVTQSGGQVSVHSQPGAGTTFFVRLPERPAAGRPATPVPADPGPPRVSVLLVDDEPEVREVLAQSLAAAHTVRTMASAEDALALSDEELTAFHVVVTDQRMPGRSGVELANLLRRRHPRLGVVLISGDLSTRDRGELPAGARFLQKPFTGRDLAEAIRRVI